MLSERPSRLVPFLAGAAIAAVVDAVIHVPLARDRAAASETPAAVPAQKPAVVQRDGTPELEPEKLEPVLEVRAPAKRPVLKDGDGALRRALARRGLELDDLEALEPLSPHLARVKKARAAGDAQEVEAALAALVPAVERAPLTQDLLKRKLTAVNQVLKDSAAAIPPKTLDELTRKFLDLQLELERTSSAGELDGIAVSVAKLSSEARAARQAP